MTLLDIRPPEDHDILIKKLSEIYTSMGLSDTFRHRKKNGETIFVDIYYSDVQFQGKSARLVLVNDITERLSYYNAIEAQNIRLRDIAWTQSHVLRAPLARIMGLVGLLQNGKLGPDEKEKYFKHVLDATHELDEIIHNISSMTQEVNLSKRHQKVPKE